MRFGLSGQLVLGGYPCYIWAEGSPAICLETTILLILCFAEPGCCVKTQEEVLRILQREKPELVRDYGVKRLALFGSYARNDQDEDSDVDILVEVDPSIGLGFVELAERIEGALGVRAEVVSRRAIKPRYWEVIKEDLIDVT